MSLTTKGERMVMPRRRMIVGGRELNLSMDEVLTKMRDVRPEPIREHLVEIGDSEFPPKQVLATVTGWDRQSFTTMEANRVLTRLGFECSRIGYQLADQPETVPDGLEQQESYGIDRPVRVFVSYSHDSPEHRANILDLTQELRRAGIDAQIDQFVESSPPLSWPLWMNEQIGQSNFVLLVVTETYATRFMNREQPGRGLGVRWEGAIITSELYHASDDRVKFIPVVVRAKDSIHIPAPLRLTTWYDVGIAGNRNLEPLLRHLLNQPAVVAEPIGPVLDLGSSVLSSSDTDPSRQAVDAAMARALEGDRDGGVAELEKLLDNPSKEVAAAAAYNLGRLWQEEDSYSLSISAYQRAIELLPGSPSADAAINNLQLALQAMNAHYGPEGPVHAAQEWLKLIRQEEIRTAWEQIDRDARLALAQAWILANESHPNLVGLDRDDLAARLSQAKPTHFLSRAFLATQLDAFQRAYQAFDQETWGAAEKPRRFGLDLELVIFMMTGGDTFIWESGTEVPAIQLLMRRHVNTWYVAGFSPEFVIPGWPPTSRPLPDVERIEES
jgi:tetratricopeptide (TPR) repeat protein